MRANALPHPTRQEWRSPAGTIIHEPSLWLPFIVIRFDGVRLGGFPTWAAAREEMARCEATQLQSPERLR